MYWNQPKETNVSFKNKDATLDECISCSLKRSIGFQTWDRIKDMTISMFYTQGLRIPRLGHNKHNYLITDLCINGHINRRNK